MPSYHHAAEPGLAGRMLEYVTELGERKKEVIEAVGSKADHALTMVREAIGDTVLAGAGLGRGGAPANGCVSPESDPGCFRVDGAAGAGAA